MSQKIIFSIIIPAFNEERYIRSCLTSVFSLDFPEDQYEVILVDNGSTDKTMEYASEYNTKRYLITDVKVGAVRNFGVAHANGMFLVFLDSDCTVDPDWLNRALERLSLDSNLVLGGQYLLRESPSWLEKYWILQCSNSQVHLTTLVGGCIFIAKEIFKQVNGFKEDLHSGEDSDLTYRLKEIGFTVEIVPNLSVVHLGFPSDVISFVKRQIWHSADYITNIKSSIKDKIFAVTVVFFVAYVATIVGMISLSLTVSLISLFIMLSMPFILSYKRVARSKTTLRSPIDFFLIYCVDVLYLVGRSLGVLISLRNRIFRSLNNKKICR